MQVYQFSPLSVLPSRIQSLIFITPQRVNVKRDGKCLKAFGLLVTLLEQLG